MKKTIICVISLLVLLCAGLAVSAASEVPTEAEAYQRIIAMKKSYPHGMRWTNANYATWKGGPHGASGCMGFAFKMSDAAFGDLPARDIYPQKGKPITISDLRVGDILRLPGHSVVVLEKHSDHIIITEGNYQRSVYWGRKISASKVKSANYYTTRYPAGYTEPKPQAQILPAIKKVAVTAGNTTYQIADIDGHWAQEHIKACVSSALMTPHGDANNAYFKPNVNITRAEVVTALYRAKGSPKVTAVNSFTDVTEKWSQDAISWAAENGIVTGVTSTSFAPNAEVTREQLAVIMYRFAGAGSAFGEISGFADCKDISSFAETAVRWAVGQSIISGKNGCLLPKGKTTRAEFATMMVRFSMAMARA